MADSTARAGDRLRAAYYAVQLMDDATAQRRFGELTRRGLLAVDDADEPQMLADRLKVTLRWRHLDLTTGEWRNGRGPGDG